MDVKENIMCADNELVQLQQTLYNSKNPTRNWLHNKRKNWIISKLYQYRGNGSNVVLEVGPGAGIYIPALIQISDKLLLSDREIRYLNYVKKIFRDNDIQIIRDDITCTEISFESIDLILCTEVIEHIENSLAALYNLYNLLKQGGILILSTPQKYSPLEICSKIAYLPFIIDIVRQIYREPVLESGHINLMTEKLLKWQILSAGFSIIEQNKSGMYIPFIAEFFGNRAVKWEQKLEKMIMDSYLDMFLWTQYYVLKK